MKRIDGVLAYVPLFIKSRTSIVIGVVLFAYLVVLGTIATLTGHPAWVPDNMQLILGNYTNVLSMVGASIAAAAADKANQTVKVAHEQHRRTHELLTTISAKLDTEQR